MFKYKAVLLASITVFLGLVASANVVYDAGAALRENFMSGTCTNHYTDVNGGIWEYRWRQNITDNGSLFGSRRYHDVFPGLGGESSPWIRVNATGSAQGAGLDKASDSVNIYDVVPGLAPTVEQMIEPGEIVVHPRAYVDASNGRLYAAIRFKAPEDGWYEADVTVRDLMRQIALCSTNADGSVKAMQIGKFSGAQVTLLANGVQKFQQIVSLENYATNTWYAENGCTNIFTYHMPATRLAKDQNIDLVVGNKDDTGESIDVKKIQNYSDSTGVKMTITKLDRIVYDAGKALRQNVMSASPVGTGGATYTDELGGQWKYLKASRNSFGTTTTFDDIYHRDNNYWGVRTGSIAPWLCVNISGEAQTLDAGEILEPDELYMHPGNPYNGEYSYSMLRFIVPESGYYSAFMSAHDVSKQTTTVTVNSGADVALLVNGVVQANGVVSVDPLTTEIKTNATLLFTRRFDFQMPVRYMAAGETIDFVVGPNGTATDSHTSDGTGMKAYVTRENEGMFYDSGLAMKNNLAADAPPRKPYQNPYGTVADGTWYYCNLLVPYNSNISFGMNDEIWASRSRHMRLGGLLSNHTRSGFGAGFAYSGGTSPFLYGNTNTVNCSGVAPGEIYMHPSMIKRNESNRTTWTNMCSELRFRPPKSGWYSGSIVVRDVAKSGSSGGTMWGQNGVRVYLNVGNVAVTNAQVELEAFTNSTAHITFGPQLLAAGEPVDIVVYPNDNNDSDGTAVSAIFRREQSTYDAGLSFFNNHAPGKAGTKPFDDTLGGITWDVGYCTHATNPASFTTMPSQFSKTGTSAYGNFYWRGYDCDGSNPRVMVVTNGVAGTNTYYYTNLKCYVLTPCEIFAQPGPKNNTSTRNVALRAKVPVDGIYSVRGYVRDLWYQSSSYLGDGVLASVGVDGCVPVTVTVGLEIPFEGVVLGLLGLDESSFSADRLWLRKNANVDFVIDQGTNSWNQGDYTGLSACIVNEGATPSGDMCVVNVDFTDTDGISPFRKPGREGWSEWRTWSGVNITDYPLVAVDRSVFTEASGSMLCNMRVTITGDNNNLRIAEQSDGNLMQNLYLESRDSSEVYTFTISNLKANEPYTLYLYSARGNRPGQSVFSIAGVEKSPDCTWFEGYDFNDVARFDVMSDPSGKIEGTFRRADDVTSGYAAFNGFTIVGPQNDVVPGSLFLLFK